jgi:transcriptional regulator with XRE-family HTH domain
LDFAVRLKQVRTARGLSQSGLGSKLGLSKQAISNYESSANTPTHTTFLRMADELGVSLDFLTGRTDAEATNGGACDLDPLTYEIANMIIKLSRSGKEEVSKLVQAVMQKEAPYKGK